MNENSKQDYIVQYWIEKNRNNPWSSSIKGESRKKNEVKHQILTSRYHLLLQEVRFEN